jgi:hypothetical protein
MRKQRPSYPRHLVGKIYPQQHRLLACKHTAKPIGAVTMVAITALSWSRNVAKRAEFCDMGLVPPLESTSGKGPRPDMTSAGSFGGVREMVYQRDLYPGSSLVAVRYVIFCSLDDFTIGASNLRFHHAGLFD